MKQRANLGDERGPARGEPPFCKRARIPCRTFYNSYDNSADGTSAIVATMENKGKYRY